MEEIIKTQNNYSLNQEDLKKIFNESKTFRAGKKNLKRLQTETQTNINMLEEKIKELKEEQRKIQRAYELQEKQEMNNSNTRLANLLWLVKNLSLNNVITNDTMAELLSKKTGSDYTFKVDIHSSGSSYNSNIWGELKLVNEGKEIVVIKREHYARSIEVAYLMKNSLKQQLENINWFTTWAMKKNGITEKDLENNGFQCEYSPVFCKGNEKLDNLMFEVTNQYILENMINQEQ